MFELFVELISYTNQPEAVVSLAARTTYTIEPPRLGVIHNGETDADTIRRVIGYGHYSVLEHANFTFMVKGVSRSLTHQLVRHRIASFSQQSQRYVKFDENNFVNIVQPAFDSREAHKLFYNIMQRTNEAYTKLIDNGVPPEDARFVLPNATATNIMVTMNARELLHFFNLRCCNRAQWEIRELANKMLELVKVVAPTIFEKAGASCVSLGYCPEGKLSCGKLNKEDKHGFM